MQALTAADIGIAIGSGSKYFWTGILNTTTIDELMQATLRYQALPSFFCLQTFKVCSL
jgi:hypothetical protein